MTAGISSAELAYKALARARRWLQSARRALEDGRWDDAVYSSQMAVELSSKGVLLALGIDYPREHDVSDVFIELRDREDLPAWFREEVPALSRNIAELAELRGLAGYGYERGIDADYFKDYAPEAYGRAEEHVGTCERLLDELFKVANPRRGSR